MNDLLDTVIEAHGSLERWNQLDNVSARLVQGGVLWPLKGQAGVLDDVVVTASLHEERVSHRPFGAADRHSAFTPERVAIETDDGAVLEDLDQPRASFAGHTPETPWSTLQLAYFVGTAMWTYLTQPFTFTLPGFQTSEMEPWDEGGQHWRRLRVAWPSYLATHSIEQTLYFNNDEPCRAARPACLTETASVAQRPMNHYLIDTDWIIDALHSYGSPMQTLIDLAPDGLAVSIISYGELYEGAYDVRNPQVELAGLTAFLKGKDLLPLTTAVMEQLPFPVVD